MVQVLVIDDRADIRLSLKMLLEDNGYQVVQAENPQKAQLLFESNNVALILLDMNFSLDTTSGEEGLAFLSWMAAEELSVPTIVMTAWSNVDLVVRAIKLGANDFLEKPWKNKQLLHLIEQQLELDSLHNQNAKLKQRLSHHQEQPQGKYQWQSESMLRLFREIEAVANTDVSVLFRGDNGTGKSELAQFLHQRSSRKANDFISVNMGAIADALFESEMFGHKKGAFTDAISNRIGRFELAEGGTLFLDEIANIPLSQQAKMLRVLESGEYEILGSSQTQHTDFRLISATNGDINRLIKDEQFREDLYFRLNTIEFTIPPLAGRREDIVPLAEYFIGVFRRKYNREEKALSEDAKMALLDYHWPGNIRELSHLVERSMLLNEGCTIDAEHLALSSKGKSPATNLTLMTLRQAEITLIQLALRETQNNIPQAAELLGLTKASMYRRLEKYELDKD